jgi:glucokinase
MLTLTKTPSDGVVQTVAQTPGPLALGFDIGGTNTKIGLVSPSGEVSALRWFPTDARGDDPGPFLERLVKDLDEVLTLAGGDVIGIGMSLHGYTDENRQGPILCLNTPALHGVNLRRLMVDRFNLPVVVNNDLTAHALAEYHFGSGRHTKRFLCMAIGTGLGAGVIINGEPLRYVGGCAGDTGHIILEPGGPSCSAGCKGCAEALCGVEGIERLAGQQYGHDVSAHEVIRRVREDSDPIAVSIIRQIGRYLGQTLASLSAIYLPEKIALTGGTAEAGQVLLDACRERFDELVADYHKNYARMGGDYYSGVEIVLGEARGETGVIGAVAELLCPYLYEQST